MLEKVQVPPFIWCLAVVAVRKNRSNKAFCLSTFLSPATPEYPLARSTLTHILHPHTVNMGKVPQMQCQGTRYEPYKNSSRRRASPPPDSWGIHAGSQDAQLNGGIFDLLEDISTRFGSRDLRELFRDHANQPGPLGQAIETWIQYDEVIIFLTSYFVWAAQTAVLLANSLFQIRGPRQPELTDFLEIQRNGQSHWNNVPGPIPGDESRTSRSPVGQPAARNVSFLQDVKSLIVDLNSHCRFSSLDSTLSIQMPRQLRSVCVVFASL